jgi:hypothetical protein
LWQFVLFILSRKNNIILGEPADRGQDGLEPATQSFHRPDRSLLKKSDARLSYHKKAGKKSACTRGFIFGQTFRQILYQYLECATL